MMDKSTRMYDTIAEQVTTDGRYDVKADTPRSGTLTKDGDPFWIAAKLFDIIFDPMKSHCLIP